MKNSSGQSIAILCVQLGNGHYSLKKVQGKKKRDAETAEQLKKALEALEAAELEQVPDVAIEEVGGGGDLLSSKDEDVIF